MSAKASPSDIAAYLVQVKTLLSNGKYDFVPRRKNIAGKQFYVKVKIVWENGEDILKCMSFHEDDFAR